MRPDIADEELLPDSNGFQIYRKDRISKRGGGVLIAVNNNILSFLVDIPCELEIIWVAIASRLGNTVLGICYRPPDSPATFVADLHDNITAIRTRFPKSDIFLFGDFNYPDIDWLNLCSHSSASNEFMQLTLDFSFVQLVNAPTRDANILDLILSSAPERVSDISYNDGFSDHQLLQLSINAPYYSRRTQPKQILNYRKADFDAINRCLEHFSEILVRDFSSRSVNENWTLFKEKIAKLVRKHIPRITLRVNISKPWYNNSLRALKNKKKRLFRAAKRMRTDSAHAEHRLCEASYCHAIRKAKHKFLSQDLQSLIKNNPAKFWKTISPSRTSDTISLLDENKCPIPQENCPVTFNDYFTSVFTTEDYSNLPQPQELNYPFMTTIDITAEGVASLINSLKVSTSSGVDGINTKILKHTIHPSSIILCHIFRQSLATGEIPYDWKIGKIIPVYKSGDKNTVSNYRPISLTSIPCKLLEHIVASNVARHLENNDFFFPRQHGFRKGFSCDTQLIELTSDLFKNMDENYQTDCIFIDFSRAFDRVAHCRLIAKISSLNLDSLTVSWIRNFISFRKQFTVTNNFSSPLSDVTSGVPQGSVLGPLLFSIFINDLPSHLTSSVRLFADDCIIYRQIRSTTDHAILQQDLECVTNWCTSWQMTLNTDKCKIMTVSRKHSNSLFTYSLNSVTLSRTSSYKYLGVYLTSNLSWAEHIQCITAKASRTLGYLIRNLHSAPVSTRKLAYLTFVRPQLEYASAIWSPHQAYLIHSLEAIQNRAARFISHDYNRHSSVTSIKLSLSLTSLQTRRDIALLCLLQKLIYSRHASTLPLTRPMRTSRRLHNNLSFQRLFGRTLAFNSSALPRAIKCWNGLPDCIATIRDPLIFKNELTTFMHP